MLLGGCIWGVILLERKDALTVETIRIDSDHKYVSYQRLEQYIAPYYRYNFFTLNINKLAHYLQKIPGINEVKIYRQWPFTIKIIIDEEKPIARWGHGQLLSSDGNIFSAVIFKHIQLPLFISDRNTSRSAQKMITMYQNVNTIIPSQLNIAKLNYQAGQWFVTFQGKFGHTKVNELELALGKRKIRQRLKTFVKAYPHLTNKRIINYMDFRYTKGFAVQKEKGQ